MASSALYRYFPSRDDLLTALIIDAYDAVGAEAEAALEAAESAGDAPIARWQAVCRAVRDWAREHPHEYTLIYGSPVPGYAAPEATTTPAARVGLVLIRVAGDAWRAGALRAPEESAPGPVLGDMADLAERLDSALPDAVVAEVVGAWVRLFGLVSFELFGQLDNVVAARDAFFEHGVYRLADEVGLVVREGGRR